jgi:hypothetical protein
MFCVRRPGIEPGTVRLGGECAVRLRQRRMKLGRRASNPRAPTTLPTAYKAEGIPPSWPPRSRTELHRLIRAAPSTGWVVANARKAGYSKATVTRASASNGARPLADSPSMPRGIARGKYARRDSNPQQHGPRPCPSASCGTSASEPPRPQSGTGPTRAVTVRERSRSRARRHCCLSGIRTQTISGFRVRRPASWTKRHRVRKARFERAWALRPTRVWAWRGYRLHHSRVRRRGLEPRTAGLRIHRSTVELAAREPYRGVEPR